MRQLKLRHSYRDRDIVAQALVLDEGVHISLYGGDLTHIGAVGVVDPEGNRSVTQFPGHREGVICERWCAALSAANIRPAVMEAGIHYDDLDRSGIQTVLALTDGLLDEMAVLLSKPEK